MAVLVVEREGSVTRLTLNRPGAGNALDLELARALREAATTVAADDECAVVVLAANGSLFCAGGDVTGMTDAESVRDYMRELAGTVLEALLAFARSDIILIGAVQGAAAGGGLGLVLNCDHVVAADGATFLSAYAKIAVSPDCGSSYLLPRTVGRVRAAEVTLAGRVLDSATAREWGIVNAVVTATDLGATVAAMAERIAGVPRAARIASKRLLAESWLPGYAQHLNRERDSIAALAATEESAALRSAFLKR